jgi:diguanylate cyclase (GGDEF)-like protein
VEATDVAALRRRLAALQQVSMAAATNLDQRDLARVVLDETVRILGAERAFLFLLDADTGQLAQYLGRDGDGNDIEELTAYSTTLVDRVHATKQPLVVTGSEEGVALGSRSAQIHGLRSIMVAPLMFEGRLRGVVYLDSRIAKGMFDTADVDLLTAITTQVATRLETARAAGLALDVQVARRQRDVAQRLHAAMRDMTSTLDPDEVMARLLSALSDTLHGDAAVLISHVDGRLVVTASHGAGAPAGTVVDPVPAVLVGLTGPVVGAAGDGRSTGPCAMLGSPKGWLALPVAARGDPLGVLLVGSGRDGVVGGPQVEIAGAMAGQGMTAYENARLFSQVRRMATVDGLTGLYTRSHFFNEASRQCRIAQRYRRPLAAIMVDIDHFKRTNDSYGHPVGDEVIRAVAARLRAAVRDIDVLGRYGGEEFALLTPETGVAAARLAERLRAVVCAAPVPTAAGPLPVTISVGLAYLDGDDGDLSNLLARADAALYEAKQGGRNRVATAAA